MQVILVSCIQSGHNFCLPSYIRLHKHSSDWLPPMDIQDPVCSLFFSKLLAISRDGENTCTDLKNSLVKWCHVGKSNIKCFMSSTPAWHNGQTGTEGCLYLQEARIFISTRSLVKMLRIWWKYHADHFDIYLTIWGSCSIIVLLQVRLTVSVPNCHWLESDTKYYYTYFS